MRFSAASVAAASLFVGSVVADVDPIIIDGTKFFYKSNGTQFFIKGISYQQDYNGINGVGTDTSGGFNDPLADPSGCKRDIPLLKELEINTIRVYSIDPTLSHDACMNAFADAGIYVLSDLSSPKNSINSNSPVWNDDLYAYYASVVDAMAPYTNTLGFFAGNEVVDQPNNTQAAPFVKAAVRDMKAYIKQKKYRTIGVGYATDDNQYIREQAADFFNCGDTTDAIDFWGYNIYSWCGYSSYETSGYKDRTEEFSSYSVPTFFAEYGCVNGGPRPFTEVLALYGSQMTQVWSGGVVYMYFAAASNPGYGIVSLGSNNQVTKLAGFSTLSSQIQKVTPTPTQQSQYSQTNSPQACPTVDTNWTAKADPLPPTPNEELCSCMYEALSCRVDPGVSSSQYKGLFGEVCGYGKEICAGIQHNPHTAQYGAYSMCNSTQQLGWAFDIYYLSQKKASTACNFKGNAQLHQGSLSSGCKALIKEAGADGTGTVTSSPTGTGAGSAGGGSAASSSGAASSLHPIPSSEFGILPMAVIAALAGISGMAMILL